MRDAQAKKAAQAAFYASRRAPRAKILQVPAVNATADRQTMRSVLVPATVKPITWAQARAIGRATVRTLEGREPWPGEQEAAIITKQNIRAAKNRQIRADLKKRGKLPMKVRRDPRGEWWATRFADLVERRRNAESAAKATEVAA